MTIKIYFSKKAQKRLLKSNRDLILQDIDNPNRSIKFHIFEREVTNRCISIDCNTENGDKYRSLREYANRISKQLKEKMGARVRIIEEESV